MKLENMKSIEDWKNKLERSMTEKSLQSYLDTLSFFELINEAHEVLDKLKKHPLDKGLAIESRILIKEITKRVEIGSDQNQTTLDSLEERLDQKFLDIDLIF